MPESEVFLSVVLPCRNQGEHIGAVLPQYLLALAGIGRPFELVVVPNACLDNTLEVVAAFARQNPAVRIVENPKGGWGLSVRTGLEAARGAVLCYTNTARTDPRHIPALLDLYQRQEPCLAKVRREKRGAPLREVGSWLYNLEARLLFGLPARDVNGTPKIFSKELFKKLRPVSDGDLLDLELMAKATRLGFPVVELPLQGFRRLGGKSSTNLRRAWNMYLGAWRLRPTLAAAAEAGA